MFITKPSNLPIGLDISNNSIKMAQIKKSGNGIKIQALGKTEMPNGIIENGEIKNKKIFLQTIHDTLNKPIYGSFFGNEVVACLPESKTYIELLKINKSSNKLEDILENEIEKYFPFQLNDIYYDWQKIDETSNIINVLVGASEKNTVNHYTDILNAAKLSISALEIESTAICRALLLEEAPKSTLKQFKNYAIIDIGASRTNMIIYSKNTIALSISIPISGNDITIQIANILEINREQAEKAKIICGLDESIAKGIIKKILSETLNKLIDRIKSGVDFFHANFKERGPISEIILSGGGANIKDLNKIISDSLAINTNIGNVFTHFNKVFSEKFTKNLIETHNLTIDSIKDAQNVNMSIKQNSSTGYATAIGLSLRELFINK